MSRESLKRTSAFTDLESDDKKDMSVSILPFNDENFQTKMLEVDTACQAAPNLVDSGAQTVWRYPKNASTQYAPRELEEKEQKKLLKSKEFAAFMQESLPL